MEYVEIQSGKNWARLYRADCLTVLPTLERVDCVITDPPFSERTHDGHGASAKGHDGAGNDGSERKALGYRAWTPEEATKAVGAIASVCGGWLVVFNDHTLAPTILAAMDAAGRYTFAPLPFYAPGSTCRLAGDGPSSWTTWLLVSRTAAQHRWGTLPGGYVQGRGWDDKQRMGGKPTLLMQAIVGDYSHVGDTVLDPYMGAGSTGVACLREGRNFIGVEIDGPTFAIAERRIRAEANQRKMEFST